MEQKKSPSNAEVPSEDYNSSVMSEGSHLVNRLPSRKIGHKQFPDQKKPWVRGRETRVQIGQVLTLNESGNRSLEMMLGGRKRKANLHMQLAEVLKKNRIQQYVRSFAAKITRTSAFRTPISYEPFQQKQDSSLQGFEFTKRTLELYSLLSSFFILFLCLLVSLSLAFSDFSSSNFCWAFKMIGVGWLIVEMSVSFLRVKQKEGRKIKRLKEIAIEYFGSKFLVDGMILVLLICQLASGHIALKVVCLAVFLKIPGGLKKLQNVEGKLFTTFYSEQYWQLVKIFLTNFGVAHCVAIILILMSWIDQDNNWMKSRHIEHSPWVEQYSWAYYWSTTIMLTVGFGDFAAVNYKEALCLTLIETVSCLTFAYNINCLGNLINKLKANQVEKTKDLKVWKRLSESNELNCHLEEKMHNFIQESYKIETKVNFAEERAFIEKMPRSLKGEFLRDCNKKIVERIKFFTHLTFRSILEVAERIELTIAHPDQIVLSKFEAPKIQILKRGLVGYFPNLGVHRLSKIPIDQVSASHNMESLLCQDFLRAPQLKNYDLKSIGYSLIYVLSVEDLKEILTKSRSDFEFFAKLRDAEKINPDEYECIRCSTCQTMHCKFRCPRLHYMPLMQEVIYRHIQKEKTGTNKRVHYVRNKKYYRIYTQLLEIRPTTKEIVDSIDIIKHRNIASDDDNLETSNPLKRSGRAKDNANNAKDNSSSNLSIAGRARVRSRKTVKSLIEYEMKRQIKEYFEGNKLRKEGPWGLECDLAENYTLYFPEKNPKLLAIKKSLYDGSGVLERSLQHRK